jgi:hypothetical protein
MIVKVKLSIEGVDVPLKLHGYTKIDPDAFFFEAVVVEHRDPACGQTHRHECECSHKIFLGRMLPDQGW